MSVLCHHGSAHEHHPLPVHLFRDRKEKSRRSRKTRQKIATIATIEMTVCVSWRSRVRERPLPVLHFRSSCPSGALGDQWAQLVRKAQEGRTGYRACQENQVGTRNFLYASALFLFTYFFGKVIPKIINYSNGRACFRFGLRGVVNLERFPLL